MTTPLPSLSDSSHWIGIQAPPLMQIRVFGPYAEDDADSHRTTCLMVYNKPARISLVFSAADRDQAEAIVEQFMRDAP